MGCQLWLTEAWPRRRPCFADPSHRSVVTAGRLLLPPQDRLLGGFDVVRPADRHAVWCLPQKLRVFLLYLQESLGESVEGFLALRFRRLDHERFGHDEREIHSGGMEAEIEEPLGDVHSRELPLALQTSGA